MVWGRFVRDTAQLAGVDWRRQAVVPAAHDRDGGTSTARSGAATVWEYDCMLKIDTVHL